MGDILTGGEPDPFLLVSISIENEMLAKPQS